MIDWDRIGELRDEVGAEDLVEIADVFLSEMTEALDPVRLGRPPADPASWLHFLKGAALNLGFADLARLCADGEGAGNAPDYDGILALFDASAQALLEGLALPA